MLVHVVMTGSPEENLATVWTTARQLYNHFNIAHNNRFGTLKMTMFKVSGSTKLRGKAGEIRSFGPVVHRLWQMYYNPKIRIHAKIELCLRLGCRMEEILDEHPHEFTLPGECWFVCLI